MSFLFDEATHSYTLNGQRLPSVTQILKPLYDFSSVHPDVLARAAAFGTAVHKTVELYLADDLDESGLDENLEGPLMAFKAWQSDNYDILDGTEIVERINYHAKLKYAGTPDISAPRAVIDIKSRPVNLLTDSIQLAAYDYFGSGKRDRFVLELRQDASYVFTHLNPTKKASDIAWSRFRYLLDYHNMNTEIQKWRK
jgi:hypothetical protein